MDKDRNYEDIIGLIKLLSFRGSNYTNYTRDHHEIRHVDINVIHNTEYKVAVNNRLITVAKWVEIDLISFFHFVQQPFSHLYVRYRVTIIVNKLDNHKVIGMAYTMYLIKD